MAEAARATFVDLEPEQAFELWTDVSRWPTFIDGFGRLDRLDDGWPEVGARVVWRSVPSGRGVVTETVRACEPARRLATDVLEERLTGTQTVEFAAAEGGGAEVRMALDYRLSKGGAVGPLVDLLFIRRAQVDALARTLRRFATEAAEQAAL